MINPDKPYHTRSPNCEAEILIVDEEIAYGRCRAKHTPTWIMCRWHVRSGKVTGYSTLDGMILPPAYDLIQEPEVEEIVWQDVVEIVAYHSDCHTKSIGFDKPIIQKIIKGDKVKIEGGN